jgi:hypothetical protein
MGRASNIEAEFPRGIKLPDALRRLCDYLDRTDYPISGNMRLRPDDLKAWFGENTDAWEKFACFGAGQDGSIIAFWLYAGPETTTAPIVHLGSDGDALKVLADNFHDFLMLFGIGYHELGFVDLSDLPQEPETAVRLRDWLLAEFGIQCPKTGIEIAQRAQARHPDFAEWIRAVCGLRDQKTQHET